MSLTILSSPPTSGSIPERWYDAHGICTWVRFEPPDQPLWAGVFGNGDISRHSAAILFGRQPLAFVIAGGVGYIVDVSTGQLIHKTERETFVSAICVPDRDFVIACDWTELYAIDRTGEIWRSERIALDGIVLEESSSKTLTGRAWQDGWHRFELTYEGWKFEQKELIDDQSQ